MQLMSNETCRSGRGPRSQPDNGASPRVLSRTLAYRVYKNSVEVYDLDFAAYCIMERLPIADMVEEGYRGNGRPPNYRFVFNASEDEIRELSVKYTNSESARFADSVRRLKKAIRSTGPREG